MTGVSARRRPGILLGIGVASVIAVSAMACAGERPAGPADPQPPQGTVATQPPQGTAATQPTTGVGPAQPGQGTVSTRPTEGTQPGQVMPVPPTGGVPSSPPVVEFTTVGRRPSKVDVAVGSYAGAPAYSSSGYTSYPVTLPGVPVRSTAYGFNAQEFQNPSGIWVTGIGEITVKPDLALLSIGVEGRATTVAEARDKAAVSMQAVIDAAKANGVAANDISTQYFSIYPEYRYVEVRNPDGSYGKQELVGYVVNNTAQVKIRNIEDVGKVIDATAIAGGDLVRVNNVQFTVDDTTKYAAQMRQLAVKDAVAKASVYAQALNVKVGSVTYLAELSSQAPIVHKELGMARDAVAAGITTQISPDTMTLSTSIQIAFSIAQ